MAFAPYLPKEYKSTEYAHCAVCRHTHTHIQQSPRGVLEAARKYFFLTRNVFLLVLIFRASQGGNKKKILFNEKLKPEQSAVSHFAGWKEGGRNIHL